MAVATMPNHNATLEPAPRMKQGKLPGQDSNLEKQDQNLL